VGHVDNVDHQFQVARPRKPQACALPGVDNVDNHFAIVHMIHIFFRASSFFLRGNSLRVDLWTMWTIWTIVLNRRRMRRQPSVTHTHTYISTSNFYLFFIIHIVHNPPQTAPLLALRVDNRQPSLSPHSYPRMVHKTWFMQLLHNCAACLQSAKESVTLEARFGENGKLQ
jgi:hypothetical protein